MDILKTSIFHIDWQTSEVTEQPISPDNADLEQYITDLLNKIAKGENRREFEFSDGGSIVRERIDDILNGGDYLSLTRLIATRLMQKESQNAAENINLKHEIPKGFVIQLLFHDDDGALKLIISKSDHSAYLDKTDLKRHLGLPIEKKTYKAFLTSINADNSLGRIFILDTTTYLAKYWWSDFLELKEKNTDTYNTGKAFDEIESVINGIRKKHPADHTILRNSMIGYFKTNQKFDLDNFLAQTIDRYSPEDPGLDKGSLTAKLREAPAKIGFDTQFNILPELIRDSKIKSVIHLSGKIDLVLKDSIEDLKNVITAVEENGVKYVRIRSDDGYEKFSKK